MGPCKITAMILWGLYILAGLCRILSWGMSKANHAGSEAPADEFFENYSNTQNGRDH